MNPIFNMRNIIFIAILLAVGGIMFFSCAKWKDPKGYDPNLPHHYCNDPAAVNYNWNFPGKPDNTVCFYPTDLFGGTYFFRDSIYRDTLFIRADSFTLTMTAVSHTKINVAGFCLNGNTITLTAGPTYIATVDTTEGDTTTINHGQMLCRIQDTVSGTISKDRVDSTLLHITLQVASDTGMTTHYGNARKQ
ncbi:MAG: hypothetical protein ACHQD8_05740 [Chitinophagales bacterium]